MRNDTLATIEANWTWSGQLPLAGTLILVQWQNPYTDQTRFSVVDTKVMQNLFTSASYLIDCHNTSHWSYINGLLTARDQLDIIRLNGPKDREGHLASHCDRGVELRINLADSRFDELYNWQVAWSEPDHRYLRFAEAAAAPARPSTIF
jgi:hypothetical protein